jgi:hypothetical protein
MLGAGSFISALLRVVTTVAVLAAVYFFIVKPILKTTEDVSHRFNVNGAIQSADKAIQRANIHSQHAERKALRQARITIHSVVTTHGHVKKSVLPPIIRCIQRANGDVDKIEACNR